MFLKLYSMSWAYYPTECSYKVLTDDLCQLQRRLATRLSEAHLLPLCSTAQYLFRINSPRACSVVRPPFFLQAAKRSSYA